MIFASGTAPHWRTQNTVPVIMRQVIYSLLPGIAVYMWFFGIGVAVNCLIACLVAVLTEAAALWVRRRPVKLFLSDYSAIVTAILLALCLPVVPACCYTVVGDRFRLFFCHCDSQAPLRRTWL